MRNDGHVSRGLHSILLSYTPAYILYFYYAAMGGIITKAVAFISRFSILGFLGMLSFRHYFI